MKKLFFLALCILFSISCSSDKNSELANEASIKVLFKSKNSLTGKNVQRGLIPVTVDIINIHTRKKGESLYINYPFTLVDNGTVGVDSEFVLRNLQMGEVDFSVFTNGGWASNQFGGGDPFLYYGIRKIASETGSLQSVFDKYSVIKPGIFFTATGSKNMIAGVNEPITFSLVAGNGRIISIYVLSQELKDLNYTAKIEAFESGSGILNKNNCVVRYEGTKACFKGNGDIADEKVTVYDDKGVEVAVFIVKPIIENGQSTNTIYTVKENDIPAANTISSSIFIPDFKNDPPTSN